MQGHFDNHGVVLKETEIIHDGINTNLFGDIQYGHYLNAKRNYWFLSSC